MRRSNSADWKGSSPRAHVTDPDMDQSRDRPNTSGPGCRAGSPWPADPQRKQPDATNHDDGGHGVYFMDPAGHAMELITVPYGGWTS